MVGQPGGSLKRKGSSWPRTCAGESGRTVKAWGDNLSREDKAEISVFLVPGRTA